MARLEPLSFSAGKTIKNIGTTGHRRDAVSFFVPGKGDDLS